MFNDLKKKSQSYHKHCVIYIQKHFLYFNLNQPDIKFLNKLSTNVNDSMKCSPNKHFNIFITKIYQIFPTLPMGKNIHWNRMKPLNTYNTSFRVKLKSHSLLTTFNTIYIIYTTPSLDKKKHSFHIHNGHLSLTFGTQFRQHKHNIQSFLCQLYIKILQKAMIPNIICQSQWHFYNRMLF